MKHGDFSGLAQNYSSYRPGYSESVLRALIALLESDISKSDLVDVGAGTGIWSNMLAKTSPKTITAVEPNDDMRNQGMIDSSGTNIVWKKGTGENTGLESGSADMISMASSFHWVDFEKGCKEFHRVLKDQGRFVALWNPRQMEQGSFLKELEDYLYKLKPDLKRVSSGNSGITEILKDKLYATKLFEDVVYIEGRHTVLVTPEKYIGAWRSVNDIQFQLGQEKFEEFISYITSKLNGIEALEVTYLTRAWSARKIV